MALPTRPVYVSYIMSDGTPNRGYVEFTMTSDLIVDGVGIIQVHTIRKDLDATGRVDTELLVTDNPAIHPSGWLWSIEEKIINGNMWYFDVPTGDDTPLNLAPKFVPGPPVKPAGVIDHGTLVGLGDDDHPQYLTKSEGDTYYAPIGSGAGGTSRIIQAVSTDTTAGDLANTDYYYKCSGTMRLTLPSVVGNNNLYTIKNVGTGVVTVDAVIPQGVDGSQTFVINTQFMSISVISDDLHWMVV